MDSLGRLTACCASSPRSTLTSSLSRPPTHWAKALGLALLYASAALALRFDELPEPTAHVQIRIPALDVTPRPAPPQTRAPKLGSDEELMVDTRKRLWEQGEWVVLSPEQHELRMREEADPVTESLPIIATTADPVAPTDLPTATETTSATSSAPPAVISPLPTFFDGGLSNNFTAETCPAFINSMIAAPEFQACYPLSLLLPGSLSFYEAEKSFVTLSQVLDHACAANVTSCSTYLAGVASSLRKSEHCGGDYAAGNPTVTSAYSGLIAYQVVYSATCLKDAKKQSYCFANAVTNTTYGSEAYFYFLPLNSSLPGATRPLCGQCLQDTMSIYHVATANRKQPIAYTYKEAATMVIELCGASFANATLADALSASGFRAGPSLLVLMTAMMAALSWLT